MPIIDFVLWLSLMKSILNKHNKFRKENFKIYGLSIKGSKMELSPVFKDIKLN
ncbi:rCG49202 [Rattus norvegicus]|uniref:RCG49202 n=1 Tax=Rattus norvegicus TaxID=10116 RepID=A6IGP4_RAT|nr:rCG49202 [Rattus norvegicus]